MAIEYGIDRDQRLLLLKGLGTMTVEDVLAYLREVVARPDVAGYNGLVDLTGVKDIVLSSIGKIQLFAQIASRFDVSWTASRLAIVAPDEDLFGLGRMYETYRGLQPNSSKKVGVFHTLDDALAYLDMQPDQLASIACTPL